MDRTEVERRIGPTHEPLEVLSGGLVNLNVRVGDDRVLRIYPNDLARVGKEASLLKRAWRSFRVPELLATGSDFLLMRFVAHEPLAGCTAHGAAIGRALAEVHDVRYAEGGLLAADLSLARSFGVDGAPLEYAWSESRAAAAVIGRELTDRVLAFFGANEGVLRAAAGPPVLLHGDFKASNLHWTGDGVPLVLDWEFAWAGSRLYDVAQLIRWQPPAAFVQAFAANYRAHGGELPDDWQRCSAAFDLCALLGMVGRATDARLIADVRSRIAQTLAGGG